jgi:hypothetical protein
MNRRIALKQLGFISAGALLLPSCVKQERQVSITLKNIAITGDQEALLSEIAEAIIPATDTPGAKEMNLQSFVLRMVDDCQDNETQKEFERGLNEFEKAVDKKYSKPFAECTASERKTFLMETEELAKQNRKNDKKTPLTTLYSLTKRYTVQGFVSSEYIMTNVLVYNMTPGKFIGCVPIKDKNDILTVIG